MGVAVERIPEADSFHLIHKQKVVHDWTEWTTRKALFSEGIEPPWWYQGRDRTYQLQGSAVILTKETEIVQVNEVKMIPKITLRVVQMRKIHKLVEKSLPPTFEPKKKRGKRRKYTNNKIPTGPRKNNKKKRKRGLFD